MKKVWIVTRSESFYGPDAGATIVCVMSSKKNAETALKRLARQGGADGKPEIRETELVASRPQLILSFEHDHGETILLAEQYDVATNAVELKRLLR